MFKCRTIIIPPLVGMLIFGCIARNFFGDYVNRYYPLSWAEWSRKFTLCIILLRGGLKLKFASGLGKIVAYQTIFPSFSEAILVACITR